MPRNGYLLFIIPILMHLKKGLFTMLQLAIIINFVVWASPPLFPLLDVHLRILLYQKFARIHCNMGFHSMTLSNQDIFSTIYKLRSSGNHISNLGAFNTYVSDSVNSFLRSCSMIWVAPITFQNMRYPRLLVLPLAWPAPKFLFAFTIFYFF